MDYGSAGDAFTGAAVALWGSFVCLMYVIPMGLATLSVIAWIVALVDLLQREPGDFPGARSARPDPNERLMWVLVVVLAGVIGAIVYYSLVMKPFPRGGRAVVAPSAPPSSGTPPNGEA